MKDAFNIFRLGIKNPRFFIESIVLKKRAVFAVYLLTVAILAAITTFKLYPFVNRTIEDITGVIDYIPDYQVTSGKLSLDQGEKPLYYQSNSFQLVIDDRISSQDNGRIPLEETQKEQMSTEIPINLFLFQDRAFASAFGRIQELPLPSPIFANGANLAYLLSYADQQRGIYVFSLFLSACLSLAFIYGFEILIIALLFGFYNHKLTQPLLYGQRLKLAVMIGAVPFIAAELVTLFLQTWLTSFTLASILTLILFYIVIRNHTIHVHTVMQQMEVPDFNALEKRLNQVKRQKKKTRKKDKDDS